MLVREYDSSVWKYISYKEWADAEDKAGKNSAFASTRCPSSISMDVDKWLKYANS